MSIKNNAVVCADVVIVRCNETNDLQFLAVKTDKPAFQGKWACPGGKLDATDSTVEQTAIREVSEETGLQIEVQNLELLGVFSQIDRDPRFRSITAAFFYTHILTLSESLHVCPGSDSKSIHWLPLNSPGELAFDHNNYIALVAERSIGKNSKE